MRTRIDIMEEQLQIVLGAWGSGPDAPFSFDGEHYQLDALSAQPGPVQSPHPPLIMGGAAGKRVAALAARYADEYNTAFATLEQIRERRANIERACAAAGREMLPFSVMTGVLVGTDERDLRARAGRLEERSGYENLVDEPPPSWIVATVEAATERLRRWPRPAWTGSSASSCCTTIWTMSRCWASSWPPRSADYGEPAGRAWSLWASPGRAAPKLGNAVAGPTRPRGVTVRAPLPGPVADGHRGGRGQANARRRRDQHRVGVDVLDARGLRAPRHADVAGVPGDRRNRDRRGGRRAGGR